MKLSHSPSWSKFLSILHQALLNTGAQYLFTWQCATPTPHPQPCPAPTRLRPGCTTLGEFPAAQQQHSCFPPCIKSSWSSSAPKETFDCLGGSLRPLVYLGKLPVNNSLPGAVKIRYHLVKMDSSIYHERGTIVQKLCKGLHLHRSI